MSMIDSIVLFTVITQPVVIQMRHVSILKYIY